MEALLSESGAYCSGKTAEASAKIAEAKDKLRPIGSELMGRNQEVMRGLIRLIRIYTPFICTVMALLNGVLSIKGVTELPAIYLMTTLTGNSVLVDLYMFATSMRMCVWYKLNLLCLLLIQICGLVYNYYDIDTSLYLWTLVLLSAMGILFFLIFRISYSVTRYLGVIADVECYE